VLGGLRQGNDPGSARLPNPKRSELTMSDEKSVQSHLMNYGHILALRGLRLPAITLKALQAAGIYCQPAVSIEHQHLAGRYVLRAVESGGAVADLGAYCGFVDEDGQLMSWLQRVDSIAVNGVHAIVVAPRLMRLQTIRVRHTYDLLITKHVLAPVGGTKRPALQNSIVFYGRRGTLEMDLCGKDSGFCGTVLPQFLSRSGEPATLPEVLEDSVALITAAASCVGCRHSHLLQPGAFVSSDATSEMGEVLP
jgi:hypothetical protein